MRNVKVEILHKIVPTQDTIVGKVYDALLLEDGDLVPDEYKGYEGQVNQFGDTVCFVDEAGEGVAVPLEWAEDSFKVTELN